ncbi:hypothetical protein CN307_32450 [Bacillus cereus]|uniref:Uncharacterized protein n=1 Tax=Bacillus cereus TaxID=1396 RepID=A0A2A8ZRR5_BACCE|nr:hypothetical protein CN307_32450 [Bacillus cereus]
MFKKKPIRFIFIFVKNKRLNAYIENFYDIAYIRISYQNFGNILVFDTIASIEVTFATASRVFLPIQ